MKAHITTFAMLLAVFVVLTGPRLHGQDFGNKAETQEPEITISADDPGIAEVYKAQSIPQEMESRSQEKATQHLREWADANNFVIGSDESRERIIYLASEEFDTDNPATDPNFILKRERAARIAELMAKDQIISFILMDWSAMEQVRIVGHPAFEELAEEGTVLNNRMEEMQREVAKLLELTDKAEAAALAGATTGDRINALLDAAISRLGRDFDADKIAADKRDNYERLKSAYADTKEKYDALKERAEKIQAQETLTYQNTSSRFSAMPLYGATVLQQAESWNATTKKYEVAVLMCWSNKLQRAALATLAGDVTVLSDKPKSQTVQEWLKSMDASGKVGSWRYIDDKGRMWFLGIAARPVSDNTTRNRANRLNAQRAARSMALFSLFADVQAKETAELLSKDIQSDKGEETHFFETFDLSIMQKIENLPVSGLGPVGPPLEVTHRLSGLPLHVSVYGINPQNAALAMKTHESMMKAAIEANRNMEYRRGQTQEWNRQLEASKNDPKARAAGAANVKKATTGTPLPARKTVPGQKTTAAPQEGSIIVGTADDDF